MVMVKLDTHGAWVIQYSLVPQPMGCTMVMIKLNTHGSWIVQVPPFINYRLYNLKPEFSMLRVIG